MGNQDLALRKEAIPYYANVWGYNRGSGSDVDISTTSYPGDLSAMTPSSYIGSTAIGQVNAIRVLQPQYGDIIEANLNLRFKMATAEAERQFRIGIGYFSSRYTAQTTYTNEELNQMHAMITGRNTPYTIAPAQTLAIQRFNLYPAMYHRGEARFKDDAFVVLLVFDQAPSKGTGYTFTKFELDCTMQMGLS